MFEIDEVTQGSDDANLIEDTVEESSNVDNVMDDLDSLVDKKVEQESEVRLMYVGPTIPDFAIQNRVYTDVPDNAIERIKKEPELRNLFIEIKDYPKANRMLREGNGYISRAFEKALEFRK